MEPHLASSELRKREIIKAMLSEGVLISPDMLPGLETAQLQELKGGLSLELSPAVLSNDTMEVLSQGDSRQLLQLNWLDVERARAISERTADIRAYSSILQVVKNERCGDSETPVQEDGMAPAPEVLFSSDKEGKSWGVRDFVSHLRVRFTCLSNILRDRPELNSITTISRAEKIEDAVSFIGFVKEKSETKNKNLMLTIEDQTGTLRAVVSRSKPEVFEIARDLVLDDCIGLLGKKKGDIVFVSEILLPEMPMGMELKKYPGECLAAVISDIHVGSVNFLEEEFERFISWLRGETGNEEQCSTAKRIKYLFILGDLVAGIGIYPGQEEELTIPSLKEQFDSVAGYLSRIPKHIHIIIIPGNHDCLRLEEPQPPLDKEMAAQLWSMPNVLIVSNPAWVRLLKDKDFPGFDFLLYHGYSFIYYADSVDSLRSHGGVEHAGDIMKYLLRRRHLAPSQGSTLYIPDPREDPLIIQKVPDFFLCGHLHKSEVSKYEGTTLICGSCWERQTSFEKKLGLRPEPCRVPIIDFHTREVKVLKFSESL